MLITVYKSENPTYFKLSLESMLNQTVPSNDIVIVKDGPVTDLIQKVIDESNSEYPGRIKQVQLKENVGLALNAGLEACENELIARMDSDDISLPVRCEKQLAMFKENPELDIVGTQILEFQVDPSNIVG